MGLPAGYAALVVGSRWQYASGGHENKRREKEEESFADGRSCLTTRRGGRREGKGGRKKGEVEALPDRWTKKITKREYQGRHGVLMSPLDMAIG
jgi:hypothetical protein